MRYMSSSVAYTRSGSGDRAQAAEWGALRDRLGPTRFVGYDTGETTGEVLALVREAAEVDAAEAGQTVEALFDEIIAAGQLVTYHAGEVIWTPTSAEDRAAAECAPFS